MKCSDDGEYITITDRHNELKKGAGAELCVYVGSEGFVLCSNPTSGWDGMLDHELSTEDTEVLCLAIRKALVHIVNKRKRR